MRTRSSSLRRSGLLFTFLCSALLFGCGDGSGSSGGAGGTGTGGTGGTGTGGTGGAGTGGTGGSGQFASKTIAQARALAEGDTATVQGFVTVAPGTFNSATGDQGFVIQDDTGGIYVGAIDLLDFKLDQHVTVKGTLAQVSKQTVLVPEAGGAALADDTTKTVAPKAVGTKDVGEANEGLLIQVSGKVTQAVMDDVPYGQKVYINDGSGEVQVFVHLVGGLSVINTASLAVDQTISVVGVSGQFDTTYEVLPRKSDDLTLAN